MLLLARRSTGVTISDSYAAFAILTQVDDRLGGEGTGKLLGGECMYGAGMYGTGLSYMLHSVSPLHALYKLVPFMRQLLITSFLCAGELWPIAIVGALVWAFYYSGSKDLGGDKGEDSGQGLS